MKKINILIIGFGPHAKRIYYPICKNDGRKYHINLAYAIDLENKKSDIETYLKEKKDSTTGIYLIPSQKRTYDRLSPEIEKKLNQIVKDFNIKGVIIATEPQAHKMYAKWALSKGLNILMDKPISVRKNLSSDLLMAQKIEKDYEELKSAYLMAKKKYKRIMFSINSQRRWHPAFIKMRSLIDEVFKKTNCPITSIQSFHSDGQWRLPSEIIDIDYHGFNQGFGKCSHSGYHFFDITTWLLKAGENSKKFINNVDIFVNLIKPSDFVSQITFSDYKKLFSDFKKVNKYSEKQFKNLVAEYGEIDAFCSFSFKHNKETLSLATTNLIHNGFSQRGWLTPKDDLYKGNGRLRHETHFIEQGPFQAISYISYQSKEVNPLKTDDLYEIGGEYHSDIHIFRNTTFFPKNKAYEKISIRELGKNRMSGKARGHQEDARRSAVIDFFKFLNGKDIAAVSDFLDHERATKLMSGVYQSSVNRIAGKNALLNISF